MQAVVVVALLLLLGYTVVRNDTRQTVRDARQDLLERGTTISLNISAGLAHRAIAGEAIAATLERFPDMTPEDFHYLAGKLRGDREDIVSIALAPDLVVKYVYPLPANHQVIGLDYRNVPEQLAGIEQARAENRTVIWGPAGLVQGGTGMILRIPYARRDDAGARKAGIVSVVIDDKAFFATSGLGRGVDGARVALRRTGAAPGSPQMIFGDASVFAPDAVVTAFGIGNETWELGLIPVDGWPTIGIKANRIRIATLAFVVATLALMVLVNRLRRRGEVARRQLVGAIEAIDDGFALFDKDDRLVICNRKYHELYGDASDLLTPGRSFREIGEAAIRRGLFPEAAGREKEWLEARLAHHRDPQQTIEQQLEDGTWLKIAERRTADGGTAGFRVDITELKRARESAEEAARTMAEFLNNINHEIRTPLSVIVGFIGFLAKPEALGSYKALEKAMDDPAGSREDLVAAILAFAKETGTLGGRVEVSARHLAELVRDTLDMAKIQNGVLEIHPQEVDLTRAIADCAGQFAETARKKGIRLDHFRQPVTIRADPLRLRQILINVIGNAVKFTDAGSVSISCKQDARYTSVIVADTGMGIAAQHIPHIFKKFWQVDGSVTRKHGGTGLGLAISRELMELHGGRIDVTSDPGVGSTFTLRFPRRGRKDEKPAEPQA